MDNIEGYEKISKYWKETSDKDYNTMKNLLQSGDYSWALFIGHLVIEKLLKAYYVKNLHQHPIYTHDLLRLATKSGLQPDAVMVEWLDDITTFNINARYDSYKQDFYRLCTKEFSDTWSNRIELLRQWLKEKL